MTESHRNPTVQRVGLECPERHGIQTFPAHTNLYAQRVTRASKKSMAYKPLECTQTGQAGYRGRVQGAKRTHKPHDIEGRLVSQNKCTQAPGCRGRAPRAETSEHKPHDIEEVGPSEPRQVHTSPVMQRAQLGHREKIHTSPYLPSFGLQCRKGPGKRSTGKYSRDK